MSSTVVSGTSDLPIWRARMRRVEGRAWAQLPAGPAGVLALIVVGQATWLAVCYARGWFFSDDFSFLRFALHRSLGWSYLSTPFNVHFAPGLRLSYWLIAHTTGLEWWPTVVSRLVLQALTTVLLFRLLSTIGVRPRVVGRLVALYAFSAALIPSTAYIGNATNQVPSQLAVVAACLACLRWRRSGRRRWALGSGVALLVAASFWEKAAVTGFWLVVVLVVCCETSGTVHARLRRAARDPFGWLLVLAPLVVYAGYFLSHHFGQPESGLHLSAGTAVHLVWVQWSRALWPAAIGGPLHWYGPRGIFNAVADPPLWLVIVGQLAFAALFVAGVRRHGWRSLGCWCIVLVPLAVGQVLVAAGRFAELGKLTALDYHYLTDVAPALLIAVGLAVGTGPGDQAPPRKIRRGPRRLVGGLLVATVLGAGCASSWFWLDRFAQSPAHGYVDNLVAGARRLPPNDGLFDVSVPPEVASVLEPYRHVSDFLQDAGVHLRHDPGAPFSDTVATSGKVVPATFAVVSSAGWSPTGNRVCPRLVQGATRVRFAVDPPGIVGDYFLRISYYQQRPVGLRVVVTDPSGRHIAIRGSNLVAGNQQLATQYLSLGFGRPAAVDFVSQSPATNVCLTSVELGLPVPVSAP